MDLLKKLICTILKKYHVDPVKFSGRLSFEIEVKDGQPSILSHSIILDSATLH